VLKKISGGKVDWSILPPFHYQASTALGKGEGVVGKNAGSRILAGERGVPRKRSYLTNIE